MKRNRIIGIVLVVVCVAMLFTACGKDTSDIPEDILVKMGEANDRATLMENGTTLTYQTEFAFSDGSKITTYTYQDKDKYVYEEDGYIAVDIDGKMYAYDENENHYIQHLFIGEGAYEEDKTYWGLSWYQYSQDETISSATEKDGVISITAEIVSEDYFQMVANDYWYSVEDIKKVVMYYEVDADSYLVQKLETRVELNSGETVTCQKVQKIDNSKNYDTDSIVKAATEGDMRKITLIENSGTDNEQVYEFSLPKGVATNIVFVSGYEQAIYADPECTTKLEATNDYTLDVTGYIRKGN